MYSSDWLEILVYLVIQEDPCVQQDPVFLHLYKGYSSAKGLLMLPK